MKNHEAIADHFFRHLDIDQDGEISRQDLFKSLQKLSISPSQRVIERIHKDLDFDQDGKIFFPDFMDFLKNKHPTSLEYSDTHCKFHIEKVFDYWDKASIIDLGETTIPDEVAPEKSRHSSWVIFLSGGFAGAVSRTTTAPLDRLKVILQANLGKSGGKLLQEMKMIYKDSGWRGFFLGNGTNVLKIAPETGVKFLTYDRFKRIVCQDVNAPKAFERLICGGIAGVFSQLVIYPLEITKTRLALAPIGLYKGIGDCIAKIIKFEGCRGLYKGLQASITGVVPYASIDLAVYNTLRDHYSEKNTKEPGPLTLLMCGAVSSISGQIFSYPFAVIRTRLQSQGMPGIKGPKYDGMRDCIRKISKNEGVKGFYKGILPNFMKTVPAISISYVVFENTKRALTQQSAAFNKNSDI